MKVVIKEVQKEFYVDRIRIEIGDTQYRLSETNEQELVVNKYSNTGDAIYIKPSVSNEIRIK